MKIGILTFHRAHNYGAILQAFALQTHLKSLNHDVEFIDYKNNKLLHVYKWFNIYRFKTSDYHQFISEIKLLKHRKKRYEKFINFINNNLNTSLKKYNLNRYDIIIVGSDQVWNTQLTNGFDDMYWGNFHIKNTTNIISYAASMQDQIPNQDKERIRNLLNKFTDISVREENLAKDLGHILNRKISVVVDPTLLQPSQEWDKIATKRIINEPYLLLYQVRKNIITQTIAEKIAKKLNLRIIHLSASIDNFNSKEVISAGPKEFISLFKYADFVVCTSFHGTVFSIIYNIPFCSVLLGDGKDNRVKNLLSKLEINERGVYDYNENILQKIDWDGVQNKLEAIKEESKLYLSKYLK